MALPRGARVGSYEVLEPIRAGGRGEVYRARDSRLGRQVALRTLPPDVASDPGRLSRVRRETLVLAGLNHPNIGAVYGLDDATGPRALVMELVEGPTLAERLMDGRLPVDEALRLARQIAEALEYAHERGVVHRDLSPTAVRLTREGTAKLVDFGASTDFSAEAQDTNTAEPATRTLAMSDPGLAARIASYLSPEQAAARPVDKRSDIWAFGVLLWEMLTGKRLFEAETLSGTLSEVQRKHPDWKQLPASTPAPIRGLLARCLDRDPNTRLRDIGEARVTIDRCLAGTGEEAAAPQRGNWMPWLMVAAALLAAGLFVWWNRPAPVLSISPMHFAVQLPPRLAPDSLAGFAVSPDGKYIVMAGLPALNSPLWLRAIDAKEARTLPGTENALSPFWSPDGKQIGFVQNRQVKRVALDGTPPVVVASPQHPPVGLSWGAGGKIAIGTESGPLEVVDANGGEFRPLLPLDTKRQEVSQRYPQFLSDGDRLIYFSRSAQQGQSALVLAGLGSQDRTVLMPAEEEAMAAGCCLLIRRQPALLAQPWDEATGTLKGQPIQVLDSVGSNEFYGLTADVSNTGLLAYRDAKMSPNAIRGYGSAGQQIRDFSPPVGRYQQVAMSPDGKRLAVERLDEARRVYDIWLVDLATGTASPLSSGKTYRDPVWSLDGRSIFVGESTSRGYVIWQKPVDGGMEKVFHEFREKMVPEWVAPDGSLLLADGRGLRYFLLPPDGKGEARLLYQPQSRTDEPAISPDGRWVAFGALSTGAWEIYVARYPGFTDVRKVSTAGGMQPRWTRGGKQLMYMTLEGAFFAMDVAAGETFQAGTPRLLFLSRTKGSGNNDTYAVSPDGNRIYVPEPASQEERPIQVLLNWDSVVRKKESGK